jgi:hypothetical protein
MDTLTCEKLLIRCQLLLAIRKDVSQLLEDVARLESLVFQFTREDPELCQKQRIGEIEELCNELHGKIAKVVDEHMLVIGKAFYFKDTDLYRPQNLKIKMTSMLLQGLNAGELGEALHLKVEEHKVARKKYLLEKERAKKEKEQAQRDKYNKNLGYAFQKTVKPMQTESF